MAYPFECQTCLSWKVAAAELDVIIIIDIIAVDLCADVAPPPEAWPKGGLHGLPDPQTHFVDLVVHHV